MKSPLGRWCWAVLGVVIGGALLASPAFPGQQTQFGATVDRVQVDFIVTDAQGGFVGDLRLGELAVFEDGRPQEVIAVELVDLGARETYSLTSDPARRAGGEAVASRDLLPGELGAIVLLIDLPDLDWQDKRRFADALVAMLEKADQLRVPYAAYLVNQLGEVSELAPLSNSVARLLDVGREVRALPLARSRADDILRVIESYIDPVSDRTNNAQRRVNNLRARGRSFDAFETLLRVVNSLAARDGRTALVWVSNGVELGSSYLVERIPSAAQSTQDRTQERRSLWMYYQPDPRIEEAAQMLYRAANTSNVSVYSVDPRSMLDFYPSTRRPRAGSSEDTAGNSLRHVAEATGGEASVGASDLQAVLRAVEEDASRFYLLTYAPSHNGADGAYHEIRVEVSRPGTEVRARRGYYHEPEADRRSRMIRGALDMPGVVAGVDVHVTGIRARHASGQALLVVDTTVLAEPSPPSDTKPSAGALPPAAGSELLAYAVVRDADEEVVGSVRGERLVPVGNGGVGTASGARGSRPGLRHRAVYELRPGSYDIRVAVVDPRAEQLGAAKLQIEITDAADAWDASDPWLGTADARGTLSSPVAGTFVTGQKAGVYLEVYQGEGPVLGGRIWRRDAATTVEVVESASISVPEPTQDPVYELRSVPLTAEGGIHRGTLWLPEVPPGSYVAEIRVDDSGLAKEKTALLPFRVVVGQ